MSFSSSPSRMDGFVGEAVDEGRLLLTDILGSGNFGVVYKALDRSSAGRVPTYYAVKCLGTVVDDAGSGSRADEREIRLHAQCSTHPNIATLHRRFSHQGFLFVVLELSAGGHLWDVIDTGAFINNDGLVREVFLQLIDTVRDMHEKGVCHRDLKPENILCAADGSSLRIADFGLATDAPGLCTSAGGSLAYMTPESIERESYDPHQSDAWALCIILLNMMSGLYPWRRANDTDVGFEAFLEDERYLRTIFPISDQLDDLLERCFRPVALARPSLLQLRTEIASMEHLFAREDEGKRDGESRQDSLRPVCLSAPASTSTAASFVMISSAAAPSTPATSRPSSASFDSSALRPKPLFISKTSVAAVAKPQPQPTKRSPLASPALAPRRLVKRVLRWLKKKTTNMKGVPARANEPPVSCRRETRFLGVAVFQ
ncbi:kinase-like protein [Favolaschia claudopus]|uniref:Kinase-like protein n=1 Tax=Favolaschia claudopus TaxID=2862362 RepID=A0AAW0C8E7_9AGAR